MAKCATVQADKRRHPTVHRTASRSPHPALAHHLMHTATMMYLIDA